MRLSTRILVYFFIFTMIFIISFGDGFETSVLLFMMFVPIVLLTEVIKDIEKYNNKEYKTKNVVYKK